MVNPQDALFLNVCVYVCVHLFYSKIRIFIVDSKEYVHILQFIECDVSAVKTTKMDSVFLFEFSIMLNLHLGAFLALYKLFRFTVMLVNFVA